MLLLVALGLGLFYFLSLIGPRPVDPDRAARPVERELAAEYLGASQALEERFREITRLREPREEDMEIIKEAIERQQDYIAALGGFDRDGTVRLQELRKLKQDHVSAPLREQSVEAEMQANAREVEGMRAEALAGYRRAMDLQRTINERHSLSEHRDVGRLTRLERRFLVLEGRPLYDRSMEAEATAGIALEAGDWEEAERALREAIATQRQLNNRYRGLMYADVQRLSRMERELVSLETSDHHHEIEALVEQGREALENETFRKAADYFQQAARRQRQLNREFPNSRFASHERYDELELLAENALGRELGERILAEVELLDGHLRARSIWQAAELLQTLQPQAQRFRESYPRSDLLDEELLEKLQFLSSVQDDLALFQERIYGQLVPVPDHTGWEMTQSEVNQALYSSIMMGNPSRNRGDRLPVDSVNWHDAGDFCKRVSWILARPVRLPTRSEFRAALGSLRYVDLDKVSWHAGNSDMRTRPIATKEANSNGIHDLLGNVAEWLFADADLPPGEAYRAGGDAESSIDALADVPVQIANRRTRNRMTGFRFVVNMSD